MYLVIGRANCSFCTQAKELLTRNNKQFIYIDLASHEHADAYKALIKDNMNLSTVPQVFELIGGYTLLERKINGE